MLFFSKKKKKKGLFSCFCLAHVHVFVLMAVYWAEYSFDSLQRRFKKTNMPHPFLHKAGKTKLKKTKREEGKKNLYCWHKIQLFGFKISDKINVLSTLKSHRMLGMNREGTHRSIIFQYIYLLLSFLLGNLFLFIKKAIYHALSKTKMHIPRLHCCFLLGFWILISDKWFRRGWIFDHSQKWQIR